MWDKVDYRNNRFANSLPSWVAVVLILLLGFWLRVHLLEADAPLGVSPTQELILDGPATIAGGRNKAVFGEWRPYPGPRQSHVMYPFMNWLAFGFFQLLGVGYWQANFISVVTGLLSIALVIGFSGRHFGRRTGLIAGVFTAVNYVYIIYNRDPMAYTTVACGMALSLYTWGRGLRRPFWFFVSGAVTLFVMLFVKLPAIAFLPAALVGFMWLIRERGWRKIRAYRPLFLFAAGGLLTISLWALFLYQPQPSTVGNAYYYRTFNPGYGLEENVRFAVQSVIQMGVDYGFVARILPLFILAYGYSFGRVAQLLSRNRSRLPVIEGVLLVFLLSTVAMLLFSAIRPLRFQIILIPLLSIIAALAVDRIWQSVPLQAPGRFGRLYPLLLFGGVSYFVYQFATAIVTLANLAPFRADFADRWVILDIPLLYVLFGGSLIVAIGLVLGFIWWVTRQEKIELAVSLRRPVVWVSVLIGLVLLFDLYQYGTWMRSPQFSTVNAAQQAAADFDAESTIFGGTYAYVLALEGEIPAIWLLSDDGDAILSTSLTHLVIESEGPLATLHYNEPQLRESLPELFVDASLVKSYTVRGHLVHVYELD